MNLACHLGLAVVVALVALWAAADAAERTRAEAMRRVLRPGRRRWRLKRQRAPSAQPMQPDEPRKIGFRLE